MRLPDAGDPWLAGLPPDASPATIAMAKALWQSGARPDASGTWTTATGEMPGASFPSRAVTPNPPVAYDPTATAYPQNAGPGPVVAPSVENDLQYKDLLAQLTRARHDAIVGFGDATGTGADTDTAAQAAANPYSTTHELGQTLTRNIGGINDTANIHGALFSGANVQSQQNEYAAGAQRSYAAHAALLDALNRLTDQQHSAYWDAYNRMNTAAT